MQEPGMEKSRSYHQSFTPSPSTTTTTDQLADDVFQLGKTIQKSLTTTTTTTTTTNTNTKTDSRKRVIFPCSCSTCGNDKLRISSILLNFSRIETFRSFSSDSLFITDQQNQMILKETEECLAAMNQLVNGNIQKEESKDDKDNNESKQVIETNDEDDEETDGNLNHVGVTKYNCGKRYFTPFESVQTVQPPQVLYKLDVIDPSSSLQQFNHPRLSSEDVFFLIKEAGTHRGLLVRMGTAATQQAIATPQDWQGFHVLSSRGHWLLMRHEANHGLRLYNFVYPMDSIYVPELPLSEIYQCDIFKAYFEGTPGVRPSLKFYIIASGNNGTWVGYNYSFRLDEQGWSVILLDKDFRKMIDGPIVSKENLLWVTSGCELESVDHKGEHRTFLLNTFSRNMPTSLGTNSEGVVVVQWAMGLRCALVTLEMELVWVSTSPPPFCDIYCIPGGRADVHTGRGRVFVATSNRHHVTMYKQDGVVQHFFGCDACACESALVSG